jgi:hypothetical protein
MDVLGEELLLDETEELTELEIELDTLADSDVLGLCERDDDILEDTEVEGLEEIEAELLSEGDPDILTEGELLNEVDGLLLRLVLGE